MNLKDTIIEDQNDETHVYEQPQIDKSSLTTPSVNNGNVTTKDMLEVNDYIDKLRSDKYNSLSLDEKLESILKTTKTSDSIARLALQRSEDLRYTVERGFSQIHDMLTRLASGQSLEPDEPGTHIFDD